MSNDTFEKLYKQFSLMIKSFIKKYKGLLEEDEIHQCCCIAIMKAYNTYNNHKDMKLSNWIYQNMEWQILRELSKENKHKNVISINSTVESNEGDIVDLLDLIADDNDCFERVEDELMIDYYQKECQRVLEDDYEIAYMRWFKGYSYEYIKKLTGINDVYGTLMKSRMQLIRKSKLYRQEYNKLHHINDFTEAARLVF